MNVITIARQPRGKGLRSKKAKQRKAGLTAAAGRRRIVDDLPHRPPIGGRR
jgi:hypothetical protein